MSKLLLSVLSLLLLTTVLSAQEAPILRQKLLVENGNFVGVPNRVGPHEQKHFGFAIGGIALYAPGRTVTARWDFVKEDGTVYGSERRVYFPTAGSYENIWSSTQQKSMGVGLDSYNPRLDITPGVYWMVVSENNKPFFAERFEVKTDPNFGGWQIVADYANQVSLHYGDDGKGEMVVGLTHGADALGKKFDLALKYKGTRVAWLPGLSNTFKVNSAGYKTYRMVVPKKTSGGTWIFDYNVARQHMIDGDWSLEVLYNGKVARSYPFVIKDWQLALQGRQQESTPSHRKIVDPYYWWLGTGPGDAEQPPSYNIPTPNGVSVGS